MFSSEQWHANVSTGFYKHLLEQSIKFNEGDSSYLTRTIVTGGDRTKSTFSCWFKLSGLSGSNDWSQTFYNQGNNSGSYHYIIGMYNNAIYVNDYDYGSSGSPGSAVILQTNRLFRDTSAWYHLVVRIDTTQATAADRARVYINGVQETSFATQTINVSQSANMYVMNHTVSANGSTSLTPVRIGNYIANYNDCLMAEINYCDGQSLGPTSFGELKQGIWTPKDTSGLTFGNNGFHLTFKDDVVSEGFNTVTYTAKSSTAESVSGLGFAPDFVWTKARNTTQSHQLFDSVRGDNNILYTNLTNTESAQSAGYFTLENDGFSYGTSTFSANTYVAWAWEAGGTPTATNSAGAGATPTAGSVKIDGSNFGSALSGTIPATKISANTSKGFSIVGYTGTGSAGTIAHGLNSAPEMIIVKNRDSARDWMVYHSGLGATKRIWLNYNLAEDSGTAASATWNDTAPTSTVFSIGTNTHINDSGDDHIAYCFHSVSGYSKIGTWQNNNSTTGTQVTGLGFKPAFIILKNNDNSERWFVQDNTRQPVNLAPPSGKFLVPNSNAAEGTNGATTASIDFQDDGFQIKSTDTANGEISFGTRNYIYMAFADTREAAFFKDVTTNGNHFTPVNLDYRDSVPDTPTNNFATFNALNLPAAAVLSEGNTKFTQTSNDRAAIGNMAMSSGKWYYEVYYTASSNPEAGLARVKDSFANSGATDDSDKFLYITNATSFRTPAWTATDATGVSAQTSETVLGFAIDADNGKAFISVNGTYINSGDPAAGSNPQATFDADWVTQTGGGVVPFIGIYTGTGSEVRINFGQDSSFSGAKSTANSNADGEGHGSFQYAPPSGYLALCSQNLPNAAIIDGTEHFNTVLYTANGSASRAITGVGFSPDWLWVKSRSATYYHGIWDSVRTNKSALYSNATDAEDTSTGGTLGSLDADGFTTPNVSGGGFINIGSTTYVAWNWKAGTTFSNDASATGVGTIDSDGQVNTTAGFSIISYTGNNTDNATVAHGLSSTPEIIILRARNEAENWVVYHKDITPASNSLSLNLNIAPTAFGSGWIDNATSTVFRLNDGASDRDNVNKNTTNYIAYCFHSVEGYSKVGSYVGNGNTDGTFVYTGFRPAWIMQKKSNNTGHWHIWDSTRNTSNEVTRYLLANETNAEYTDGGLDILSNGFKPRKTGTGLNASGDTYIYLAFADQPFKFSNAR